MIVLKSQELNEKYYLSTSQAVFELLTYETKYVISLLTYSIDKVRFVKYECKSGE